MEDVIIEQVNLDINHISPIRSPQEIAKIREAGAVCAKILNLIGNQVKPGVSTKELDVLAGSLMKKFGVEPDREDLEGYNYVDDQNVFFTLNNIIARGMASDEPLKYDDLMGIDLSIKKDGWCGDNH